MNIILKRIAPILLSLALAASFFGCAGTRSGEETGTRTATLPPETTPEETQAETGAPGYSEVRELVRDGESKFTVVRPTYMSNAGLSAVVYFVGRLRDLCGVRMTISDDFVKNPSDIDHDAFEVLIGNTNRTDDADIPEYGFSIRTERNRVVILAAKDSYLRYAADYFVDVILKDAELAETGEGKVVLKKDFDYRSEKISYLYDVISSSEQLTATVDYLFTVPRPDEQHKNTQGGWMDKEGKYFYQVFLQRDNDSNEAANEDIIVKYDIEAKRAAASSGPLYLNHANDITWYPEKNCLAVVHNNPNRKSVSLVDPETLTLIETVNIGHDIYCLDYCAEKNLFVAGMSGGQNFRFFTDSFKLTDRELRLSTPLTAGYTTQGCATDENFVYFVLYKQNVITVYDWTGKFVSLISFDVGNIEPENISVVNDDIYITCANGGGAVYRVTPKSE